MSATIRPMGAHLVKFYRGRLHSARGKACSAWGSVLLIGLLAACGGDDSGLGGGSGSFDAASGGSSAADGGGEQQGEGSGSTAGDGASSSGGGNSDGSSAGGASSSEVGGSGAGAETGAGAASAGGDRGASGGSPAAGGAEQSGVGGSASGGASGGSDGAGGSESGEGGTFWCPELQVCEPGDQRLNPGEACPDGKVCYEEEGCGEQALCVEYEEDVACTEAPTCDSDQWQLPFDYCPTDRLCEVQVLCGKRVICDVPNPGGEECQPTTHKDRSYAALPEDCGSLQIVCPEGSVAFSDECGCGCEQPEECPDYVNCQPGGEDDNGHLCDSTDCPFTGRTS